MVAVGSAAGGSVAFACGAELDGAQPAALSSAPAAVAPVIFSNVRRETFFIVFPVLMVKMGEMEYADSKSSLIHYI